MYTLTRAFAQTHFTIPRSISPEIYLLRFLCMVSAQGKIIAKNLNYSNNKSSEMTFRQPWLRNSHVQAVNDNSTFPAWELVSTQKGIFLGTHLAACSFPSAYEHDSAFTIHALISVLLLWFPCCPHQLNIWVPFCRCVQRCLFSSSVRAQGLWSCS